MTDALKYEWTRLRTLRSTWWLLGTSVVLAALIAFLFAQFVDEPDGSLVLALTGLAGQAIPITGILMGLVGAFAIGHEYRYGTIRVTLPVVPRRGALLLAKVLVVAAFSVVVAALSVAVAYLVVLLWPGSTLLDDPIDDGVLARVLVGYVLLTLIYAMIGMALAGLLRNLPGAIVLLIVWPLVIESLLTFLTLIPALEGLQDETRFLPFYAGQQLVATGPALGNPFPVVGPWEGGAIFGGTALVLLVLWAVLFRRRDA